VGGEGTLGDREALWPVGGNGDKLASHHAECDVPLCLYSRGDALLYRVSGEHQDDEGKQRERQREQTAVPEREPHPQPVQAKMPAPPMRHGKVGGVCPHCAPPPHHMRRCTCLERLPQTAAALATGATAAAAAATALVHLAALLLQAWFLQAH